MRTLFRWAMAGFLLYFVWQGQNWAILGMLIVIFLRLENNEHWARKLANRLSPRDKLGFSDKPPQMDAKTQLAVLKERLAKLNIDNKSERNKKEETKNDTKGN